MEEEALAQKKQRQRPPKEYFFIMTRGINMRQGLEGRAQHMSTNSDKFTEATVPEGAEIPAVCITPHGPRRSVLGRPLGIVSLARGVQPRNLCPPAAAPLSTPRTQRRAARQRVGIKRRGKRCDAILMHYRLISFYRVARHVYVLKRRSIPLSSYRRVTILRSRGPGG